MSDTGNNLTAKFTANSIAENFTAIKDRISKEDKNLLVANQAHEKAKKEHENASGRFTEVYEKSSQEYASLIQQAIDEKNYEVLKTLLVQGQEVENSEYFIEKSGLKNNLLRLARATGTEQRVLDVAKEVCSEEFVKSSLFGISSDFERMLKKVNSDCLWQWDGDKASAVEKKYGFVDENALADFVVFMAKNKILYEHLSSLSHWGNHAPSFFNIEAKSGRSTILKALAQQAPDEFKECMRIAWNGYSKSNGRHHYREGSESYSGFAEELEKAGNEHILVELEKILGQPVKEALFSSQAKGTVSPSPEGAVA